ncbi:MAG TPA: hypothetical protein VMM38_11880, partial [Aridibacter sp.]|nr:hypothetical protein [Aridibacter sp.]
KVRIIATIAKRDGSGRYNQDQAGWYIVCNGRVVLSADKSEVSGWGIAPMPTYQPKHRSFVGLVFFESEDPRLLPWTTTKRALNRESRVYLRILSKMALAARPVISFINKQYPSERDEEPVEREISRNVKDSNIGQLIGEKPTSFKVPTATKKEKTTTRVQFDAENRDLELIRKHLRKPRMGASTIGKHTLDYFLDKEGLK